MAASDFNWWPQRVEVTAPKWNTVATEMDGMKKKVRLKSTRPLRTWTLYFRVQDNDQQKAFLAHWNAQIADMIPFNWYSIPDHILETDTAPYYVRYATNTAFKETPTLFGVWEIEITFEEVIC